MEWVVKSTNPAALPPGKRPGIHCLRGWVGPRASLDGCGKSHPHRDSIPGPSSLWQAAVPTELSRSTGDQHGILNLVRKSERMQSNAVTNQVKLSGATRRKGSALAVCAADDFITGSHCPCPQVEISQNTTIICIVYLEGVAFYGDYMFRPLHQAIIRS